MSQYEQWDQSTGILLLYSDSVIQTLQQCYPTWIVQPDRQEIEQMINGGCVFFQYNDNPYVISLGLKQKYADQGESPILEELKELTGWFSRFADIICRNCCMEEWYHRVITEFKLSKCQYIKSFFTILSNMAYCITIYEEFLKAPTDTNSYITSSSLDELKQNFEELLVFEITRDYASELDKLKEMSDIIQKIIEKSDKKDDISNLNQLELENHNKQDERLANQQPSNIVDVSNFNAINESSNQLQYQETDTLQCNK